MFREIWRQGPLDYDEAVGIDWSFLSCDGAMAKAPLGGGKTGPNPTDRAKRGAKRSALTEGAGVPIDLAHAGANRNDHQLLEGTLDSVPMARPQPSAGKPQGLCLDKAYDNTATRELVGDRKFVPHIRWRGEEIKDKLRISGWRVRRWVVEACHSRLNRNRGILVRWSKKEGNHLALLMLASGLTAFKKARDAALQAALEVT